MICIRSVRNTGLAALCGLVIAAFCLLYTEVRSGRPDARRLGAGTDFHPGFPSTVDSTADVVLRLELLRRLQNAHGSGLRNLFEFVRLPSSKRHPPSRPTGAPIPFGHVPPISTLPQTRAVTEVLPLIFYGDVTRRGSSKRALLLDGDRIHIKTEGDLIEERYRLTWIGADSVAIEDVRTGVRHTLPLLTTETI